METQTKNEYSEMMWSSFVDYIKNLDTENMPEKDKFYQVAGFVESVKDTLDNLPYYK